MDIKKAIGKPIALKIFAKKFQIITNVKTNDQNGLWTQM